MTQVCTAHVTGRVAAARQCLDWSNSRFAAMWLGGLQARMRDSVTPEAVLHVGLLRARSHLSSLARGGRAAVRPCRHTVMLCVGRHSDRTDTQTSGTDIVLTNLGRLEQNWYSNSRPDAARYA